MSGFCERVPPLQAESLGSYKHIRLLRIILLLFIAHRRGLFSWHLSSFCTHLVSAIIICTLVSARGLLFEGVQHLSMTRSYHYWQEQ